MSEMLFYTGQEGDVFFLLFLGNGLLFTVGAVGRVQRRRLRRFLLLNRVFGYGFVSDKSLDFFRP